MNYKSYYYWIITKDLTNTVIMMAFELPIILKALAGLLLKKTFIKPDT